MNTPDNSPKPSSQEELELSHDQELWDLLGKNSSEEASPLFSQNVVREIRLAEHHTEQKPSFGLIWQKIFTPRHTLPLSFAAVALAVFAAVSSFLWVSSSNGPSPSQIAQNADNDLIPIEVASSLESTLESELLIAAADTPALFSDEEVFAMLF